MSMSDRLRALARDYPAGTVLFEENDPGSRMYVIRSGKVRIFRRVGETEILLSYLEPGDFFGEMALLERMPRSATAEVVEDSQLIEVDAQTFDEMIRTNKEIAVRIMRNLASRVRELDRRVQNLILESGLSRAVEVLRWLLPQGKKEANGVRLSGAAKLDLPTQAGLPPSQAEPIMDKLTTAGCVRLDGNDLLIAERETLDEFAAYLELRRKYEEGMPDLPTEASGLRQEQRMRAMQRLLEAMQLTPDALHQSQQALSKQYERYLTLKEQFPLDAPSGFTPPENDEESTQV